jgi:uncharacterized LabA/DUF88 family protein
MKRVIVLIDGQNLYYGLKSIGLIEREINWSKLFGSFLVPDDELIRTYWFRPQKILDTYFTTSNIKYQIICKNYNGYLKSYLADPKSLPPDIELKVNQEIKVVEDWLRSEKARFAQIEYNYDQIALEFDDIEIVKTGIVKVNPFLQEYVGEKGVDISLAVRMISLSVDKKCDKIILVSGDYDYAEAIKFVKNNMTKIHIVKFHKGFPPKNRNVSRDLAVLADKVIDVYESEIKTNFKK